MRRTIAIAQLADGHCKEIALGMSENSKSLPPGWDQSKPKLQNLVEEATYEFGGTMQAMFVDDGVVLTAFPEEERVVRSQLESNLQSEYGCLRFRDDSNLFSLYEGGFGPIRIDTRP